MLATVEPIVASWPGRDFLKVKSRSCFQDFDMLKLRYIYQIPVAIEIRALLPHEQVDWDVQGWWSFYEFAFEAGFRFPVPRLVREVLFHFQIAPSQQMPNS